MSLAILFPSQDSTWRQHALLCSKFRVSTGATIVDLNELRSSSDNLPLGSQKVGVMHLQQLHCPSAATHWPAGVRRVVANDCILNRCTSDI